MEIVLLLAGGLVLLVIGGEAVVRGAVGVARRLGVSELLIGLTLVGFGTSAPELVTSVRAALAGSPGISIGNVVGSNISNILLILATIVLIKPIAVDAAAVRRDGAVMGAATLLLCALGIGIGDLAQWVGGILVASLAAYLAVAVLMERHNGAAARMHEAEGHLHDPVPSPLWLSLLIAVAGLACLIFGADLLVQGAITLARLAGVSETVIGLTVVAVGTSLPELVASLAAAIKGRADVAFGNILGSNIYNILGILGVTALISPLPFPPDMGMRDWIAFVGSAGLLILYSRSRARLGRPEGSVMLALYGAYCVALFAAP
jgi:cation:H+ antiporter